MDLLNRLNEIIAQHGIKHWSFAARKDHEFIEAINVATEHLPDDLSFAERVYCAAHDFDPRCSEGNRKKLVSMIKGWSFCGPTGKCACASEIISKKSKENVDHDTRLAKTRATLLERYGTTNPADLPQTKVAHKAFYADHNKVKETLEKTKKTMLKNYGVEHPFNLKCNQKGKETSRRHFSEKTKIIMDDAEKFEKAVEGRSSATSATELGVNVTTINNYIKIYDIRRELSSSFEDEISKFLRDNNLSHVTSSRSIISPKELDFYLPDHNLAIEFNGLYWHSDAVVEKNYHRDKWQRCHDKGIRLLMINEDEWIARSDVIKKKILNLCGRSERGCGARKLVVRNISNKEALAFVDNHHIQGKPGACSVAYGAFWDDVLVAVVTLFRQRGTGHLDLTRFCSDGRVFAGAFSKMLKKIVNDVQEPIVTFADLRYSDGGLYEKCGFINEGLIKPDYRYVKNQQTYHKSTFTKKQIAKRFGIDMSNKTEQEAMIELKYSRIYDCGKIRYRLI